MASDSSFVGGVWALASPPASAIRMQLAWAAAISSSGLVPSPPSARSAQVTAWSVTAPLPRLKRPLPSASVPSHVAFAVFSVAIVVPLLLA